MVKNGSFSKGPLQEIPPALCQGFKEEAAYPWTLIAQGRQGMQDRQLRFGKP